MHQHFSVDLARFVADRRLTALVDLISQLPAYSRTKVSMADDEEIVRIQWEAEQAEARRRKETGEPEPDVPKGPSLVGWDPAVDYLWQITAMVRSALGDTETSPLPAPEPVLAQKIREAQKRLEEQDEDEDVLEHIRKIAPEWAD